MLELIEMKKMIFFFFQFLVCSKLQGSCLDREHLGNELSYIRDIWNNSWSVGGDLNDVRFPKEKKNCQEVRNL